MIHRALDRVHGSASRLSPLRSTRLCSRRLFLRLSRRLWPLEPSVLGWFRVTPAPIGRRLPSESGRRVTPILSSVCRHPQTGKESVCDDFSHPCVAVTSLCSYLSIVRTGRQCPRKWTHPTTEAGLLNNPAHLF